MKNLILFPLILLVFSLSGCPASTVPGMSSTDQTVVKTIAGIGQAIKTVPGVMDALLTNKVINTDQYNKAVSVYRKTKASYVVAVDAEEAYLNSVDKVTAGTKFDQAMTDLNKNFLDLKTLIMSYGGKI